MRARDLAAGLLVATLAASALAHETWMLPSEFSAKVGEDVRFDASSGMAFPRLASAIRVDRVAKAAYRLGHDEAGMTELKTLEASLVLRQPFSKEGLATVWLDLNPREIELSDDEVAEYLDEIDATDAVRATWAGQKGRIAWKETYTKHAKTFVAVGNAHEDRSWSVGVGQTLELVPGSNPSTARVGAVFSVTLLASGQPLANVPIGLQVEGTKKSVFRTTDADGQAKFPLTKAGLAMFFAVRLLPAADGLTWTSDFCTMTFGIHRP